MNADTSAFSTDDTIAAIATPHGRGAIGIVRVSGPEASAIANRILGLGRPLEPRYATLARFASPSLRLADEVVATYFKAPHSYTGQDVVEISAHGSPVIVQGVLAAACETGARLARPGEFTLRAYLAGKRDLVQAEAVGDLIAAVTPLQARVAFDQLHGTLTSRISSIDRKLFDLMARLEASLDFPDEGYHFVEPDAGLSTLTDVLDDLERLLGDSTRGRVIREGAQVVICGRPNVGKSLLFNILNGFDRAIVTDVPGTTRDLLTERVDVQGVLVTLVDTAGAREALDAVEAEGVKRAQRARDVAELVLLVLDRSEPLTSGDLGLLAETAGQRRVVVANKCDLAPAFTALPTADAFVCVSARTGEGIQPLRAAIANGLSGETQDRDSVAVSNIRHIALMREAYAHLRSAAAALESHVPEEFVLGELQAARGRFDEVVGARTSSDLLAHIFERFCIGK